MKYKIERLKPGSTYIAQIRSVNEEQISDWSPAFYLTIPGDTVAPANVGTVTATYTNYTFKFSWPAVTTNSDSSTIKDFSAYLVTVSDGTNSYTISTKNKYCVINRSDYLANLGSGSTVDVSVVAIDTSGNESATAATQSLTAPLPATITGLTTNSVVGGIELAWTSVTNCDIQEYEVYAGDTAGFTPDTATFTNRVGIVSSNTFSWTSGGVSATTKYFKVRAKSWYGTYSAAFASDSDTTIVAASSGTSIVVKDEGSTLTSGATEFDFIGAGVTATNSGSVVTVSVSGGSGGSAAGYVANVGDGSNTSYTVTHGLGTKDVQVSIYENATAYEEVLATVRHTTTNSVTVIFSSAPTTNQYRVVVTPSGSGLASKDIQVFGYPDVLATYVGKGRYYIEAACTISSIRASVDTAPTGSSIIVDVNKNGTTVFTTQANRPTVAISGFTSGAVTSMDITSLAAGDYLTVDIDQIGSTIAGSDLTVTVVMV